MNRAGGTNPVRPNARGGDAGPDPNPREGAMLPQGMRLWIAVPADADPGVAEQHEQLQAVADTLPFDVAQTTTNSATAATTTTTTMPATIAVYPVPEFPARDPWEDFSIAAYFPQQPAPAGEDNPRKRPADEPLDRAAKASRTEPSEASARSALEQHAAEFEKTGDPGLLRQALDALKQYSDTQPQRGRLAAAARMLQDCNASERFKTLVQFAAYALRNEIDRQFALRLFLGEARNYNATWEEMLIKAQPANEHGLWATMMVASTAGIGCRRARRQSIEKAARAKLRECIAAMRAAGGKAFDVGRTWQRTVQQVQSDILLLHKLHEHRHWHVPGWLRESPSD